MKTAKSKRNPAKRRTEGNSQPPRQEGFAPEGEFLTTNQGALLSDNHNSLKAGVRGPTLMEDFVLREKITSFDHERIPERVVHARGAGAFGVFECTKNMSRYTSAGFLSRVGLQTPVLVRFSTVAGSRGSADTARDVRGFATKFYTNEGNYDLVGNNIPVFFIQDAMKFPDLIHAVKPRQDNEIPQASSAHDTFWDFISLMPESTHMIFWAMSDRAIPRSFRMMEGFGVHTFRFVNAKGEGTFVKFHWKPRLGIHGLVWEEAQLLAGQDADFHRRDLFEAIDKGAFPQWDLGVQLIPEADEHRYPFDLLDPTKLVPEEMVPVTLVGTMTLQRNPDNYFAEIEQAVFHPGHLVPGIDLTNDPLLQGRLFSYTDTQLTRLGGPNFHELPVNRPLAEVNNFQRDGFGRQTIPKGKVAYEPNSLGGGGCPFHAPERMKTFVHLAERMEGHKIRARSLSFGDHFSQAKLFYASQSDPEKEHIRKAFSFELSKVESVAVRERMLRTLMMVDVDLTSRVADCLGMKLPNVGEEQPNPANAENDIVPKNRTKVVALQDEAGQELSKRRKPLPKTSQALSMILHSKWQVKTRRVAILITAGTRGRELKALRHELEKAGVVVELIAPGVGELRFGSERVFPNGCLASTPSVLYDGVIVLTSAPSYPNEVELAHAAKFVAQAFKHCKTVAANDEGWSVVKMALGAHAVLPMPGLIGGRKGHPEEMATEFLSALGHHRHWDRTSLIGSLMI